MKSKSKGTRPYNGKNLPYGEFKKIPISELIYSEANRLPVGLSDPRKPDISDSPWSLENEIEREQNSKHVVSMMSKLKRWGWLVPVSVLRIQDPEEQKLKGGKFIILEGQHRVQAARIMGAVDVPCYIVGLDKGGKIFNWIESDDLDETRESIISLNNGNKPWVIWDYLKAYDDKPTYRKLRSVILQYKGKGNNDGVTPGVIYTAYTGYPVLNAAAKSGNMEFPRESFSDLLVVEIAKLIELYTTTLLPSQPMRAFAKLSFQDANVKLLKYMVQMIEGYAKMAQGSDQNTSCVPEGDSQFKDLYDHWRKHFMGQYPDEILLGPVRD